MPNPSLKITQNKEVIIDYGKAEKAEHTGKGHMLGHTEALTWITNNSVILGKSQEHVYYLRILNRTQKLLVNFYHGAIES